MNFEKILAAAKSRPKRVAVAAAQDEDVLAAVLMARSMGIAEPILIGNGQKIEKIAKELGKGQKNLNIIDEADEKKAAYEATRLVREGEADFLMKGFLQTADLLRAVIDKERGLRGGKLISHVAVVSAENYDRLLFFTDVAMNVSPTLAQKATLIENAVTVAQALGVEVPKVGVLAAVEVINPDMPTTLDAAALTQMNRRGQLSGCVVDGPFAFDNAVDLESAKHKGLGDNPVAGKADIVLAPNLEAGNILYKAATKLAFCETAGLLVGAKVPIVLTSRADSARSKVLSIACASVVADQTAAP